MSAACNRFAYLGPDSPRWTHRLADGRRVLVRPIGRHDARAERKFLSELAPQARRSRFLSQLGDFDETLVDRLTDIDYVNDVGLVAVVDSESAAACGTPERIVGASRYAVDADRRRCECAAVVADGWQGQGLGTLLLRHLVEIAGDRGIRAMRSTDCATNLGMRALALTLGFVPRFDGDDPGQAVYELEIAGGPPPSATGRDANGIRQGAAERP